MPYDPKQHDKKNAPPPPDFTGMAQQDAASSRDVTNAQTQQNRPDQTNAYGSSTSWSIGPDGRPVQSQSFGGPMGLMAGNIQQQALEATKNPFSTGAPFSFGGPMQATGAPNLGTFGMDPSAARDQAINAAYGQATSRLDPQFQQRESQLQTQLLNQGLDPSSEAYKNQMQQFGQQRNDAYGSAMNSAIGQGTAAGESLFNQGLNAFGVNSDNTKWGSQFGADERFRTGAYNDQNDLTQHRQRLSDALLGRNQAMGELGGLQQFLQQPGFSQAGRADSTDFSGAGKNQYGADMNAWNAKNAADSKMWDSILGLGGDLLPLLFGMPPGLGGK